MLTLVATSKRGSVRFYKSASFSLSVAQLFRRSVVNQSSTTSSLGTASHHQRELLQDSLVNAFDFAATNASTERNSVETKLKSAFF